MYSTYAVPGPKANPDTQPEVVAWFAFGHAMDTAPHAARAHMYVLCCAVLTLIVAVSLGWGM